MTAVLSDVELYRAEQKLEELRAKKARKEVDLQETKNFHLTAAAEYGSELCAGGMSDTERGKQNEINVVAEDIQILELAILGRLPKRVDPAVRAEIATLDADVKRLQAERTSLLAYVAQV